MVSSNSRYHIREWGPVRVARWTYAYDWQVIRFYHCDGFHQNKYQTKKLHFCTSLEKEPKKQYFIREFKRQLKRINVITLLFSISISSSISSFSGLSSERVPCLSILAKLFLNMCSFKPRVRKNITKRLKLVNTSWLKVIDIVIERKSSEKRKNFYIKNIFELSLIQKSIFCF